MSNADHNSNEQEDKSLENDAGVPTEASIEQIDKNTIPHFFPTFRITRKYYSLPIILVVIFAGFLSYITYIEAGIQIDQGYIPGGRSDPFIGLLNGLIFIATAVISAFIMIYFAKKKGIGVLKYVFAFSFCLLGFTLTYFFSSVIAYLLILDLPQLYPIYNVVDIELLVLSGIFALYIVYQYLKSESVFTKNFVVLYIGLLTGAILAIIMPLWTNLAILIGISLWDIFAVLYKKGPIKEMIDLVSQREINEEVDLIERERIKAGEAEYKAEKLEIGIGDLAFYSMLTSSALLFTGELIVMILTAIAVLIGTGITISGLKKNRILPGLPISIFLGLATMLISWGVLILV
ncbi:MAG: hypothetical protein JW891_02405 [Candidatus Lokiarchaeota archaeon]|nr:hypothetical protein [Candidatus Lokiarchaeota archaeon]